MAKVLALQVAESWTCGDGLGHFGPAILVAIENGKDSGVGANAFLSLKGQLAKCGLEHVRKASSLEQISFGAWEEAVKDVLFPWNRLPKFRRTLSLSCWMKISLNFQFPCSFGLGVGLMPRPAPSDEELIPPLTVPEVIAAIQPASQATPLGRASGFYRNREGSTAQPGTPVGDLGSAPATTRSN